jgi:dienelactone hydrolase
VARRVSHVASEVGSAPLSVTVDTVSESVKSLLNQLSNRGPHRVLRGDLAFAGQPGVVFTPAEGLGLPAVAFGHGWLSAVDNYRTLLEHLASWGIVAAAPNTERGPVPSHIGLAADLGTTLDICREVRLGNGKISVHPDKLALAGHGMGAGAAVLAATQRRDIAAVAALFPAPTAPAAEVAAAKVTVPGLIVAGALDLRSTDSNAPALAAAWGGPAVLRAVDKGRHNGIVEGRRVLAALGAGKHESGTARITRALLTGFLLHVLENDKTYSAFVDADEHFPKTTTVDPHAPAEAEKTSRVGQVRAVIGR